MAPTMLAKLDSWTIIERTSKEEAAMALGLDLRELALQDIDEIGTCSTLASLLLSANLLTELTQSLFDSQPLFFWNMWTMTEPWMTHPSILRVLMVILHFGHFNMLMTL